MPSNTRFVRACVQPIILLTRSQYIYSTFTGFFFCRKLLSATVYLRKCKMTIAASITQDVSDSPDTEGFIMVNTTKPSPSKPSPSKLNPIEASFMQKSQAISSSVKTTATAIPIKPGYTVGSLTDIASSPRSTAQSPIAERVEETRIMDVSPFKRDAPHRLSSGLSTPNFVRRTWSLEGHKRHRTSSESARQCTPPRLDLVSRSVRHSPSRRPFSANFEEQDSFYSRPLSASRVSTGQSAPAYFVLGGSPYNSPPSLKENQSPLQALTFGESSPPFTQPFCTPPELSETTIMDVSSTGTYRKFNIWPDLANTYHQFL